MIEWLPWLPSKSCYTNLKFFETLKDTPNPSKGFMFVAFLVLEILGGSFSTPPPWCLVWVPKPLVPGGLSAQMTKSLGKSIINLYSNVACSVLGVSNQQELSTDLKSDPFLNTALQRFPCDLYHRFGALLAPVSVGIITGKHYAKILSLN